MAAVMTIGPCQGCGACLLTCPEHAIQPQAGTLRVLQARCTGCGECIEICPVDAIYSVDATSAIDAISEEPVLTEEPV